MVVVTYATNNTASYAAYSMAVVAAWAQQKDYPMRIYTERDHFGSFDENDPRWSMVPTLRHAMTQWAPQTQAALWVDADLTVLDFTTGLEDFLDEPSAVTNNQQANLYVCGEKDGTLTNTGSLLAKNNERTMELLDLWWNAGDRSLFNTQEALDFVIQRLDREGRSNELHIMPTSFFNTDSPAMTEFKSTDRALHLMSSTTPYRTAVFAKAFEEVCEATTKGRAVARQLGITKAFLLSTARRVHQVEYSDALETINNMIISNSSAVDKSSQLFEQYLSDLQRVMYPLSHALEHTGESKHAVEVLYEVRDTVNAVIRHLRLRGANVSVELLKFKIVTTTNCLGKPRPGEPLDEVFAGIATELDDLEELVNPKHTKTLLHLRANLKQHLVFHFINQQKWGDALDEQFEVVVMLQGYDIMVTKMVDACGTLAGLLCQAGRYDEAMPYFRQVLDNQRRRLGSTHPSVGLVHLNRGICLYQSGNYKDSESDLATAKKIFRASNYSSDRVELRRAEHFYRLANSSASKTVL